VLIEPLELGRERLLLLDQQGRAARPCPKA
jgi:hypothetical protein